MNSWNGRSLQLLTIVTWVMRHQCVIKATLLQSKIEELFVESEIANSRSQEDLTEQAWGRHPNTKTLCRT